MNDATHGAIEQAEAKLEANREAMVSLHDRAGAVARAVEEMRNAALALMTKRQRKRQPMSANLVKAAKAGIEVTVAPDGTVTMRPIDVTPIEIEETSEQVRRLI
jgi:hypothetical protein